LSTGINIFKGCPINDSDFASPIFNASTLVKANIDIDMPAITDALLSFKPLVDIFSSSVLTNEDFVFIDCFFIESPTFIPFNQML